MKSVAKILLYVLFGALALVSLQRVRQEARRESAYSQRYADKDAGEAREPEPGEVAAGEAMGGTNLVARGTTNASTGTNLSMTGPGAVASPGLGSGKKTSQGLGGWIAGFVIGLLGLAAVGGWDFSQWFSARTSQAMGVDLTVPENKDPEYDAAEAEWSKGNHLDAITMMREYLGRNPNEQYVALRIAEIYEKDLGNHLAAALEYEEVLNQKLPREKWGWTALRLANLYSGRLNQADKAVATMERVIRDYPETAAAKKARERLGIPEPTEEPVGEMDVDPITRPPSATVAEASNLPAGFRRKK